jgi:hypothetical protein
MEEVSSEFFMMLCASVVSTASATLLLFDLSTLPELVTRRVARATLVLWMSIEAPERLDVRRVLEGWTEESVKQGPEPALGQLEAGSVRIHRGSFTPVDLTKLMRDWISGVVENHGIALVVDTRLSKLPVIGGDNVFLAVQLKRRHRWFQRKAAPTLHFNASNATCSSGARTRRQR